MEQTQYECYFFLNGELNGHICGCWSDDNSRIFREVHTQDPASTETQRLGRIFGNHIIGQFFLSRILNGGMYLDLLQNAINPLLIAIIEQDDRYRADNLTSQQNGAPPHYAMPLRQSLNETFPQWIRRRGTTEWSARSPDLSLLDRSRV